MTDPTPQQMHLINHSDLQAFVEAILLGNGTPPANAAIVAQCLVAADLRGVDTHGSNRIPSYMERIRQNALDARAQPTLRQVTPVAAQVDGRNGFGFVAAHTAMDAAIRMAREFGMGMVSVKHSNHFGMSAWVVRQALDAGMMSLVFTNSSPALPVWGGREKLMGVSPIACGAPSGDPRRPFILDMAPSVAARGKIYKALRRGEKIPEDWALDQDGARTDDPARALEGVMLPMGGPKGSALSIMMDVFSGGVLRGGVCGACDESPDLFMSMEEFQGRMDYLYKRVVESEKMAGVDRIYFPGEIEMITEEQRREKGIPFAASEIASLNQEADRVGIAHLKVQSSN
ncbi:hypothetical protein N7468_002089 [Penicillium chermesinum]|uniref:Malate/L-lactate dehydrogenase n=1 Tax=Penicillium chermesinum TaxID=63820 RepID=A0A9W9PJI1_9EURO|nr:uncharacterized protein N7468_002089 [Penicillium chermesinum]KAJ5247106.1 hypothetical protein N7468_002089 [Penicillium chermesinum]